MTEHGAQADVILVGRLPEALPSVVEAAVGSRCVATTNLESVAHDALNARVLLIGEGISAEEAQALLPSLRESTPSLVLIAVHSDDRADSFRGVDELVDAAIVWPLQQGELLAEIQSAFRRTRPSSWRTPFIRVLAFGAYGAAIVAIWAIVTELHLVPPYLVPSPTNVVTALLSQLDLYLWHMSVTAWEALLGFLIGNVAASATGILLYRFGLLRSFTLPLLTGIQAVPIVALAPLLTVWLGTGIMSKVAMATVVCYFPLVASLLAAFAAADRDLVQLFAFHRAHYLHTLTYLLFPTSYPALIAALRISGGLAVVGAIVAEFTGADQGLGYLLLNATYRLETDRLFVAILLAAALGIIFANAPRIFRFTRIGRFYESLSQRYVESAAAK